MVVVDCRVSAAVEVVVAVSVSVAVEVSVGVAVSSASGVSVVVGDSVTVSVLVSVSVAVVVSVSVSTLSMVVPLFSVVVVGSDAATEDVLFGRLTVRFWDAFGPIVWVSASTNSWRCSVSGLQTGSGFV